MSHYGNTKRPSKLLNQLGLGDATLLQLAFLEDSDPGLSMGESPIGTTKSKKNVGDDVSVDRPTGGQPYNACPDDHLPSGNRGRLQRKVRSSRCKRNESLTRASASPAKTCQAGRHETCKATSEERMSSAIMHTQRPAWQIS